MSEKSIIFNSDMVRAILEGRKSQTRRPVKPQPPYNTVPIHGPEWYEPGVVDKHGELQPGNSRYGVYDDSGEWGVKSPYQPGDILWVRETWQTCLKKDDIKYCYLTDMQMEKVIYTDLDDEPIKWRPSIHMPKEAARIFLKVTDVRVARVQDITEEDARAEGIGMPLFTSANIEDLGYVECFMDLWDSDYTKHGLGWDTNPWVWRIPFERVNI